MGAPRDREARSRLSWCASRRRRHAWGSDGCTCGALLGRLRRPVGAPRGSDARSRLSRCASRHCGHAWGVDGCARRSAARPPAEAVALLGIGARSRLSGRVETAHALRWGAQALLGRLRRPVGAPRGSDARSRLSWCASRHCGHAWGFDGCALWCLARPPAAACGGSSGIGCAVAAISVGVETLGSRLGSRRVHPAVPPLPPAAACGGSSGSEARSRLSWCASRHCGHAWGFDGAPCGALLGRLRRPVRAPRGSDARSRLSRCASRHCGHAWVRMGYTNDPACWEDPLLAEPRIMGILNVTPDSFSDGGRYLAAEAAIAHGLELGGGRRRDHRRRRRVDAAGSGAGRRARRSCAASIPVIEGLVARACRRRSRSTPPSSRSRAPRSTPAPTFVNDVTALRAEPELAALVARARRRLLPDAHAGRAADDAARAPLRRRRRRGDRVPARARRGRASRPASRASGSSSTRASASARPSSTTSSCWRASRAVACSGCRS